MKRKTKLLALCAVLVVLAAVYAAASTLTAQPEEDTAVALAQLDAGDLTALEWTRDGETLSLTRGDEGWTLDSDAAFPLDQSAADAMAEALSGLTASQVFDAPDSLEDYGLEEPALTVTGELEDGSSCTFALGAQNELTGEYYLLRNGDESQVYLVDSTLSSAFSVGLYDIVAMEELPAFGDSSALTVAQPEGLLSLSYQEDGSTLTWRKDAHWFLDQDGTWLALDSAKVSTLISAVTGLSWQSCVAYNADEAQLEDYGLGEDAAVVTLSYTAEGDDSLQTFVLRLGSDTDDGTYAALDGSRMVYLISTDTANSLRYASYSSLRSQQLLELDWDTVEALDVTLEGESYTITFSETEEVTQDSDGESSASTVALYTCGGTELDRAETEAVLTQLDALTASGDAAGEGSGEALVSFTIRRSTGDFSQLTLTLSAWDTGSCLAALTGESPRLVDRSAVTELTEALAALLD